MSKKNLILGGVLVLLVVLAFLYEGPLQNLKSRMDRPKNFLSGLDTQGISRIDIVKGGELVSLEKEGEKWKIAGTRDFYLKDEVVNSIFTALNEASQADAEIASENPGNKADLETDIENGVLVSLKQGDTAIAEFIVGKLASDFSSTYISKNDIDESYKVAANLRNAFDRSDWYDRTIFESDEEAVNTIRFQYPNREFTIEKGEDGWAGTLPYSFRVNDEKVEPILKIMTSLRASDIPQQTFDGTGLEKNSIIIEASGEGVDNILMVGDARDDNGGEDIEDANKLYFAKRGDKDNIYLISGSDKEVLDITMVDLR